MWKKLKTYAELVKIEHTLFSLPFAYTGGILAARGLPTIREMVLITLAVVGARSAGMAWNRLADRYIDSQNPRTFCRPLPQRRISIAEVLIWIALSLGVLLMASWQLNPLCLSLSPVAVLITFFYSYTKRFTWYCHFCLGLCLGLAPVGGWIGVRGGVSVEPVLIGLAVAFWTAGFDIIYATLDVEFDRKKGLYSIPVYFGLKKSLQLSLAFHFVAFLLLIILKFAAGLGSFYFAALLVVGVLLLLENWLVSPEDLTKVNFVFFQINSLVSITIFIFMMLEFGL